MTPARRSVFGGLLLAMAFLASPGYAADPSARPVDGSIAISVDHSAPEQGAIVRVELMGTPSPDNGVIHWKGRSWPMKGCGVGCFEALAGIDLAEAPGRHTLTVMASRGGGALRADVEIEVRERVFPLQAFQVPKEKDVQDPALVRRIEAEAKLFRERYDAPPSLPSWGSPFQPPVPGFVPAHFGARRVINGEPRNPHTGGDMTLPAGVPVHSIADGRVVFSGEQFFGGNELLIDHGGGIFSMYFHLAERAVSEGQAVRRGERIGSVGATGRATGPHLHFGLRVTGARVDPASLPGLVENR